MVSTAVSRGRASRWTCARRSPPWSAASSVTARSSGLAPAGRARRPESAQPVADGGGPSGEASGDKAAGLAVGLGELAAQRPKRAPALAAGAPGRGDDHVPPGPYAFDAAEVGLFLVADDDAGLVADDRLHELVLAGEVVGQLRAAYLCRGSDVVEGGAGHAPLVDQPGGGVHDPGAGPLALGRQRGPLFRVIRHGFHVIRIMGLTTQSGYDRVAV